MGSRTVPPLAIRDDSQWGHFIGIGLALMNPWVSKVLPPGTSLLGLPPSA